MRGGPLPTSNAGAYRDRADADVTVIDVPAVLGGIWRSAAGELGHGPIQATG
jgi:hypothetical protein